MHHRAAQAGASQIGSENKAITTTIEQVHVYTQAHRYSYCRRRMLLCKTTTIRAVAKKAGFRRPMEARADVGSAAHESRRYVSDSITFTAIERSLVTTKGNPHKYGVFRVPLMKSPTHFGHFTSRVNRLYNEDRYSASVLTIPEGKKKRASKKSKSSEAESDSQASGSKDASGGSASGSKDVNEENASGSEELDGRKANGSKRLNSKNATAAVGGTALGEVASGAAEGNVSASKSKQKDSVSKDHTVFSFNIFDGHGGEQCSSFLSQNLTKIIEESSELVSSSDKVRNELIKKYGKNVGGYWKRWYKHRKANFDAMFDSELQLTLSNFPQFQDDLRARLPLGFLEADYEFFESEDNKSGSTCTSTYIETIYPGGADGEGEEVKDNYYFNRKSILKLTVAHIGDTKAIIVDKNGEAHSLTEAHHPSNPNEASRLRKYAANFFMTDSFGEERFISLANTRAFGDLNFKQMGVTAEPDVSQYIIGDSDVIKKKLTKEEILLYTVGGLGGDECMLILITDGVTDILTDQEVADIVMVNVNLKGQKRATPQFCAEEVIKFVEYIGGDDNATCLVVRLNGWGHWPVLDRTGELRQERLNDFSPRGERDR